MNLQPLGDQAVMAYAPNEGAALAFAEHVRGRRFPWVVDVVQAYTGVAVYYDLERVDFSTCSQLLADLPASAGPGHSSGQTHKIPCCYELGMDLERVAQAKNLTNQEVIDLHTGQDYTVYAIGFCPGFPYLGYLPEGLTGVGRLPSPRLQVPAGSVGMTGKQTGIYTEARPGGWNILGRTPLRLVDVRSAYFPLRTGDRIRFHAITLDEFRRFEGQRL